MTFSAPTIAEIGHNNYTVKFANRWLEGLTLAQANAICAVVREAQTEARNELRREIHKLLTPMKD